MMHSNYQELVILYSTLVLFFSSLPVSVLHKLSLSSSCLLFNSNTDIDVHSAWSHLFEESLLWANWIFN